MGLHKMCKFDEAIEAYEKGLTLLPSNAVIKDNLEQCKKENAAMETSNAGGAGGMPG